MNVAVSKTKAERTLGEQFASVSGKLAGRGWVADLRREALGAFEARGLPHRRIEQWKYTDLRERLKEAYPPALGGSPAGVTTADIDAGLGPLAALEAHRLVFIDGAFNPELSHAAALRGLAEFSTLAEALRDPPPWLKERFDLSGLGADGAVRALNLAFMSDGVLLKLKRDAALDRPVLLVFAGAGGAPKAVTTRNIVVLETGARLDLIEAHVALPGRSGARQDNAATDLAIGDRAELAHLRCLLGSGEAAHLSNTEASLGSGSSYRSFQMTVGGALVRNQLSVAFKGKRAKLDVSGVMLARGVEHLDTTLFIDHAAPGGLSRELFKSVLDGRARAVFQGKIIVRPDAQKTDGKQSAHALMLSPEAEFDSKPELEIYADDVACGHGSTCAEIDPDLIFYCRTRGIPDAQARALLIRSFIAEAVDKVEDEAARGALMALADNWLQQRTP